MSNEELGEAVASCISCGNGISKRSLNLLSTTIHKAADVFPEVLIETLRGKLCDVTSPIAPTRILNAISQDLERLDPSYFTPITTLVINTDSKAQINLIIPIIFNAVFILPFKSLQPEKAEEIANKLIDLLHQTSKTVEVFQFLTTGLSQFMKKWASILPNPEIQAMAILSTLSDTSFTYSVISSLSQSAIYCICALIGDMTGLKDMISSLLDHKPTPLDKCTAISGIPFLEYITQTVPICVSYQLLAAFLFTVPNEYYSSLSTYAYLGTQYITSVPTDELGQTSFFQMLSAALKVISKGDEPDFLDLCKNAILSVPDTKDNYLRKSVKQCFQSLVQCALKVCEKEFFIDLFRRLESLSSNSSLVQDCLSMVIPTVPFDMITIEFFKNLLSQFDVHQTFAFRCVAEIYKCFKVPVAYSDLLFQRIDLLSTAVRQNFIINMIKISSTVVKTLHSHVTSSKVMDENKKLSYQILLAPVLQMQATRPPLDRGLISTALHSYDFENRVNALKILISSPRGNTKFTPEDIQLLAEAIPRVFVFCDVKYQKVLESYFQQACNHMNPHDQLCMSQFFSPLFKAMVPLLKPHMSGFRKSYIVNILTIVWHSRPLLFLTKELLENLVCNLFESSYTVRDLIFRFILFILRMKSPDDKVALAHQVISEDSKLVSELIQKHSNSTKFRDTDGAARLIALTHLARGQQNIEVLISKMWQQIVSKTAQIPPHFPLSVVLHVLQSVQAPQIDFAFITQKLVPVSLNIISESLAFIGVEANVETIPVQSIKTVDNLESQLIENINSSWLAVRQSLNIIGYVLNQHFENLPYSLVVKTGDTLLRFLMESRQASTVYQVHIIFQMLCTLSYMNAETEALPIKWADTLMDQAENFTISEHKISNSFVLTALALIHSEPAHLYASQRPIYDKFMRFCSHSICHFVNYSQLITGLLLCQAIATDNNTATNFEPYSSKILMQVFNIMTIQCPFYVKNAANICLSNLLLRHWKRRTDVPRDFEAMTHSDFFAIVEGSLDFFVEYLVCDNPDSAFIILLVIQLLKPFPNDIILRKITDMRASSSSRIRHAAARALLILLQQEDVSSFIRSALGDVKDADANTLDGIINQISELVHEYPNAVVELKNDVVAVIKQAIDAHETSYIKLYFFIELANLFNVIELVMPVLKHFAKDIPSLLKRPYGSRILKVVFKTMNEMDFVKLIIQKNTSTLYHLCRFFHENPSFIKQKVARVLVDTFLSDPPTPVFDGIRKLLANHSVSFKPNETQKEKFLESIFKEKDNSRVFYFLGVASMFVEDAKSFLLNFQEYSYFVDRSDSNILEELSKFILTYHDQLFSTFNQNELCQWLLALRIISDENPQVRYPCVQALSLHLCQTRTTKIDVAEYDLIVEIYQKMAPYKDVLQKVLSSLQAKAESIEDENGIKKDPTPFIHPPSFHVDCLRRALKSK